MHLLRYSLNFFHVLLDTVVMSLGASTSYSAPRQVSTEIGSWVYHFGI